MDERYVLFSPIGTTDPISNYCDGAMLHITRRYRPKKVYLYLSKEMLELHKKDDRYRRALRKLGEKLGLTFDIHIYERPELVNVQVFDLFYSEFEGLIKDIANENPDCTVLLNVSSGTPAIKSALQLLAALLESSTFLPIQVATPVQGANLRLDDFRKSELDEQWECNEDNKEGYKNRADVSEQFSLIVRLKKAVIVKHIEAYDYHAALSIAIGIRNHLSKDAIMLLEAANARVRLDMNEVRKVLSGTGHKIIPVEDASLLNVVEYLLWLELKVKRTEYSDFIRGVTPLIADLFEIYIEKKLGIDLWSYCNNKDKKERKMFLRKNLLMKDEKGRQILKELDNEFNCYDEKNCSSAILLPIIKAFSKIPDTAESLRKIEKDCRNKAAHEIVSVTEDTIKAQCGCTPKDILKLLFDMAEMTGIPRTKIRDSYSVMNSMILAALDNRQ